MAMLTLSESQRRMWHASSLKELAEKRALILIGCYRKADVADPEVYTRAVVAVLMQWPAEVILSVTEPASGIPSRIAWLPSIAEIVASCKDAYEPIRAAHEIAETRKAIAPPSVSDEDRKRTSELLQGLADSMKAKSRAAGFGDPKVEAQKILDRYAADARQQITKELFENLEAK